MNNEDLLNTVLCVILFLAIIFRLKCEYGEFFNAFTRHTVIIINTNYGTIFIRDSV